VWYKTALTGQIKLQASQIPEKATPQTGGSGLATEPLKNWRRQNMADRNLKAVNPELSRTLTDDQIVTEKKLPRRSFLSAAGTLLAGGAVAIVAAGRAAAQEPEKKEEKEGANDPDAKKKTSSKSKGTKSTKSKKSKKEEKASDPDSKPKQ
jgi:hypothetical protein